MDEGSRSGSGDASRRIVVGEYVLSAGTGAGARLQEAAWDDRDRLPCLDVSVLLQEMDAETECELEALRTSVADRRWHAVVGQGWAIESRLIFTGRWTAWLHVLDWMYLAACKLHHAEAEGWVFYQRGIRALCLGDISAARTDLVRAFRLRQMAGDEPGVLVTCEALDLVLGPPEHEDASTLLVENEPAFLLTQDRVGSTNPTYTQRRFLLVALISLLVALALVVAAWRLLFLWARDRLPGPSRTAVPSVMARVTTAAETPMVSFASPTAAQPSTSILDPTSTPVPSPTPLLLPTVTPTLDAVGPSAPVPVLPLTNAAFSCEPKQSQRQVTLKWKAVTDVSGIDEYKLGLRVDGYDKWSYSRLRFEATSASLTLPCNQAYFWRVQARDGAGNDGAWSRERLFSLLDVIAPPVPGHRVPEKETQFECPSGQPVEVGLSWKAVNDPAGIAWYEVEVQPVFGDAAGSALSTTKVVGSLSTLSVESACGSNYAWRVRAIDGAGNEGEWSPPSPFSVSPAPADLIVTALDIMGRPKIDAGGQVIVPFRIVVKNQGDVTAGTFGVGLAYTSGSKKTTGIAPASLDTNMSLAPDQAISMDGKAVFPASMHGASVAIHALVDAAHGVQESDEQNNTFTSDELMLPRLVTLTLRPVADACVDGRAPSTPLGEAEVLFVGRDNAPEGIEARSLLRFDLTVIPVGAEVRQAILFVALDERWFEASVPLQIDVAEVLSVWQEPDTRWDVQPEYGSFDRVARIFAMIDPEYDGGEWEITALVQAWANRGRQFGLVLVPDDGVNGEWAAFSSRESDHPPRLVIQYVATYGPRGSGAGGQGSAMGH